MTRRMKMVSALLGLAMLGTLGASQAEACGGKRKARGCGCGHKGRHMGGGGGYNYYTYGGAAGPISQGYYGAPAPMYGGYAQPTMTMASPQGGVYGAPQQAGWGQVPPAPVVNY